MANTISLLGASCGTPWLGSSTQLTEWIAHTFILKLPSVTGSIKAALAAACPVSPATEPVSEAPPPAPVKLMSSALTLIAPVAKAGPVKPRINQVFGPFRPVVGSNAMVPVASIRRMFAGPLRLPAFSSPDCLKLSTVK